jgi:PAS domain S-box-containing protein
LKTTRHEISLRPARVRPATGGPTRELEWVRARLADAEETLRAIRNGEVDSVVVAGKQGRQVFTLQGAEHAYRMLIESMNEGALILTADKTILFANQRFATMVKCPLEQILGSSFRRFLSAEDQAMLRLRMKRAARSGSKIQVLLNAGDHSQMPVQISIRPLEKNGGNGATIGMVVTDLTEARRAEEMLRALMHRVVQVQEAERGRVALELHDHITQLLCAVLVRSQTLANRLSSRAGPAKLEAMKLRELLGQTAEEVERISRNLRPSVLDELGLAAVLRDTSTEFTERTGVPVKLTCVQLTARLPADTELTLYRILQEALNNVEKHARARHVAVSLKQMGDCVQLAIIDDGIGFEPGVQTVRRKSKSRLGLLSMLERATYVGGTLNITSAPGKGTTVFVQVSLILRASGGGGRSRTDRVR